MHNVILQVNILINSLWYRLLEILENNHGILLESLIKKYSEFINKSEWEVKNEVKRFIKQMVEENVVIKE